MYQVYFEPLAFQSGSGSAQKKEGNKKERQSLRKVSISVSWPLAMWKVYLEFLFDFALERRPPSEVIC